jgi:hypothetical protein
MCITAIGAGLMLGACDRGKSPPTGPAPESAEAPKTEPPTGEPTQAETPPPAEVEPGEAPDAPADAPAEAPADDKATAGGADGKCGGVGGLRCKKSEKCRYGAGAFAPPHPDAMGTCVDQTYCDAPADCAGLMHVMTVGEWACDAQRCAWKAKDGSGPM